MPAVVSDILVTTLDLAGLGPYESSMRRAGQAVEAFGLKVTEQSRTLLGLGAVAGVAGLGIAAALAKATAAAGRREQVKIGFETVLGSPEAAEKQITDLRRFAEQTPFSFAGATSSAQQLLGLGASAEQVIPILRSLGNAASAAGKGENELNRAVLAVGQVISKGKLQGDELLQLAEAGIPLNEILKELGTSFGDVGKAGITSARFLAALNKVMGQGRFGNAMANQMNSLQGSLSNLSDAAGELQIAIGEPLIKPATLFVKTLTGAVQAVNNLPKPIKDLAGPVGAGLAGFLLVAAVRFGIAAEQARRAGVETVKLIPETVALANAQMKAAAAAQAQAVGLQQVASAAGRAAVAQAGGGIIGAPAPVPGGGGQPAGKGGPLGKVGGLLKGRGGAIAGIVAGIALDFLLRRAVAADTAGTDAAPAVAGPLPAADPGAVIDPELAGRVAIPLSAAEQERRRSGIGDPASAVAGGTPPVMGVPQAAAAPAPGPAAPQPVATGTPGPRRGPTFWEGAGAAAAHIGGTAATWGATGGLSGGWAGAGLGAVAGALYAAASEAFGGLGRLFAGPGTPSQAAAKDPQVEALEKLVEQQQRIIDELRGIKRNTAMAGAFAREAGLPEAEGRKRFARAMGA